MSEKMEGEMIVETQEEEMEITKEIVSENTQVDNSFKATQKTLTGHLHDPKRAADVNHWVAKATDSDLDYSQDPLEQTRVTLPSDSHDEENMQEDEQRKAQHGTKRASDQPDTTPARENQTKIRKEKRKRTEESSELLCKVYNVNPQMEVLGIAT